MFKDLVGTIRSGLAHTVESGLTSDDNLCASISEARVTSTHTIFGCVLLKIDHSEAATKKKPKKKLYPCAEYSVLALSSEGDADDLPL